MSRNEIAAKARRFDTKMRQWNVAAGLSFFLLLVGDAWQVWAHEEVLLRAGNLLTIAALVYVAHRFRQHRQVASPAALGRTDCVEFYRAQLLRQRDLSIDSWRYLLPFVPGLILILLGRGLEDRPTSHMLALAIFGVALFLGIAWLNGRTAAQFQKEIEALDKS